MCIPSRWCIRGRKPQHHSARTQRVLTRRISSTSQLTSRWTSWVFVLWKDLLGKFSSGGQVAVEGAMSYLTDEVQSEREVRNCLFWKSNLIYTFLAECCYDVPHNKGESFPKQDLNPLSSKQMSSQSTFCLVHWDHSEIYSKHGHKRQVVRIKRPHPRHYFSHLWDWR